MKFSLKAIGLCALMFVFGRDILLAKDNRSEGEIKFYTDVSSFKMMNQNDVSYTQLYFFMERNQFTFVPKDSFFAASFKVRVLFTDVSDEKNVMEREWTLNLDDQIVEADTAKAVPVIFENSFAVKPGKYSLKVQITDANNQKRTGSYSENIEIPNYGNDLGISQIELATQILKGGNSDEMFVKFGHTIFPNPSGFYGSNLPRLTVYAEVYNLEYENGAATNTYNAEFIVTDEAGSVIKEFPSKTFNKVGKTAILIHSINIISIQSGRYFLMIRVTDNADKKVTVAKKLFVIYREGESIYETQAEDSFFKDIDDKGAARAGNILSIIGKGDDMKIYSQLELDGKKKFLDRFWKEKDPSPGTKTNELLMDYYKRYEESNLKFSTPNKEGWKTDMGRVYLVYGPPAQIEKHEFESDKKPYQIWYYYQLKDQSAQTLFIFADVTDSGIHQLLHSTARGEVTDQRWQDRVNK